MATYALSIWSSFCEVEISPFMEKANERSSHSSISGSALVVPLSVTPLPHSSLMSLLLLLLSIHIRAARSALTLLLLWGEEVGRSKHKYH